MQILNLTCFYQRIVLINTYFLTFVFFHRKKQFYDLRIVQIAFFITYNKIYIFAKQNGSLGY